jgi:hypothetical protein
MTPAFDPAMSAPASLAIAEVSGPRWRAEPYRILFPLGALLAWAGVLHWLLLATGATDEYRSTFHAIAQIQGLMTCFAVGFLFTFIPRRTGAPARRPRARGRSPSRWRRPWPPPRAPGSSSGSRLSSSGCSTSWW